MNRVLIAVSVAVAAGVVAAWMLFQTEERRIGRQLDELAEAVSVEADETDLVRLATAARVGRFFTEDATIEVGDPYPPLSGRDAVLAAAARARTVLRPMTVELDDVEVAVADDGTARATTAATLSFRHPQSGQPTTDARDLELVLRKVEGVWLIASAKALQIFNP